MIATIKNRVKRGGGHFLFSRDISALQREVAVRSFAKEVLEVFGVSIDCMAIIRSGGVDLLIKQGSRSDAVELGPGHETFQAVGKLVAIAHTVRV